MDKQEQLWDEFKHKTDMLINNYAEIMKKLSNIPNTIPRAQREANAVQIVNSIEAKMAEIGSQFKEQMDALTEEFTNKMTETEA